MQGQFADGKGLLESWLSQVGQFTQRSYGVSVDRVFVQQMTMIDCLLLQKKAAEMAENEWRQFRS